MLPLTENWYLCPYGKLEFTVDNTLIPLIGYSLSSHRVIVKAYMKVPIHQVLLSESILFIAAETASATCSFGGGTVVEYSPIALIRSYLSLSITCWSGLLYFTTMPSASVISIFGEMSKLKLSTNSI